MDFLKFAKRISNIKNLSFSEFNDKCTIYFDELANSLIEILGEEDAENQISIELKEVIIQTLRKIIENENKNEKVIKKNKPLYEYDDDDWVTYSRKIIEK